MTTRRAAGKTHVARALWYTAPRAIELRPAAIGALKPGEARVRTLWSAVSRGTERLVYEGAVGKSEWARMRAPAQEGDFPFPVKYGYCATGIVEDGPAELIGRTVFSLHPHQDMFNAPADRLTPVPEGLPARRATLAANMETALNAHWDAGTGPGDRIVVVGAGVVGLLVAHLAARLPGAEVTVIDTNPDRAALVQSLGCTFRRSGAAAPPAVPLHQEAASPAPQSSGRARRASAAPAPLLTPPARDEADPAAPPATAAIATASAAQTDLIGADVVFHTSAHEAGLAIAIQHAGPEAKIVELSWYGDRPVSVPLGGAFHSQRLQIISSQVGQVSPSRRARWSYRRRLEAALRLLLDAPALDALVAHEIAFADAPRLLPAVFAPAYTGLAPVLRY